MHNYYLGRKQGVTFPSPLIKHRPRCPKHHALYNYTIKKNGYDNVMAYSNSHVASLAPKWFHCTFTCAMALFWSIISFLSRMNLGYGQNYPSSSTCIIVQTIMWLESCTYFFNKDTWNTLCSLIVGGKASLFANGPILSRISNGSQY